MTTDVKTEPAGPFRDFQEAAAAVLELLQERVGMDLWLMTRAEGEDWIVLGSADRGYGVEAGKVFRWSDSFCSRMVRGEGPRIAPSSAEVAAYAEAPIGRQVPIGAYIGLPITRADGSLFGTLCAIDPEPQPESLRDHLTLIEGYCRLLSTILDFELGMQDEERRAEQAEAESETDLLTGLHNRRGWTRLRDAEEERCQRYGSTAGVVMIDLDELKEINDGQGHAAGDRLLQRVAGILRGSVRATDVVARLGGDEFAVLAVEQAGEALRNLADRIESAFADAGIGASVGSASRDPRSNLAAAQEHADTVMYSRKNARRVAAG